MQTKIKAFFKEILITILLVFLISNIISYLRKPSLDSNILPSIELRLLDKTLFKPIANKALVIHFWAKCCPTCKIEAYNIQNISKSYEVLSIAVNSGTDEEIQAYMKAKHLNFRVYNDKDGSFAKQFKVQAYPTSFIYNSKGKLKFSEVGYTSTAGLLARLALID